MMFRRYVKLAAVMLLTVFLMAGCGASTSEGDVLAGTYVYEKNGFGGEFTITLYEDGTFQGYEGSLSSSFENGTWTLEAGTLCITEGNESVSRTNCFQVEDGSLTFQAEDSDNFMFVDVQDGEQFHIRESE